MTLAALSLGALLVHGYHPLAEDGGIYVAGVKAALDPALFPHDRIFVSSTEHYSMFAPLMAGCVHALHVPLPALLAAIYVLGIWLLLFAACRLAQAAGASEKAQMAGAALLGAWMTLPIAGTSLLLMDPYVTARTLSTPLCLLALACVIRYEGARSRRTLGECFACLVLAGIFHPLMMMYGAALVVCVLVAQQQRRTLWFGALLAFALAVGALLQHFGAADSPAMAAAARSRYYWFLGQWHWYELLGVLAPPVIVAALALRRTAARSLGFGVLALAAISLAVAVIFAREIASVHLVARLQPLRSFLMIYAVMAVLLGVAITEWLGNRAAWAAVLVMAATMLFVQRQTFSASPHLEWPGRTGANPWVDAFVWIRNNTPADALFAIDAHYITSAGEDGQVFRAAAERSVLPDFSKDGGQAAIHPVLADEWFEGQQRQTGLNTMSDEARARRLAPRGVTWVVLSAGAPTHWNCPYNNTAVKVCTLTAAKD